MKQRAVCWAGDPAGECTLVYQGMLAHIERMGPSEWWFEVSRDGVPLFDSDSTGKRITSSAEARAGAEKAMELLARGTA